MFSYITLLWGHDTKEEGEGGVVGLWFWTFISKKFITYKK